MVGSGWQQIALFFCIRLIASNYSDQWPLWSYKVIVQVSVKGNLSRTDYNQAQIGEGQQLITVKFFNSFFAPSFISLSQVTM